MSTKAKSMEIMSVYLDAVASFIFRCVEGDPTACFETDVEPQLDAMLMDHVSLVERAAPLN